MQGGHATCNGTVAGAMLGCKVGYSELPRDWINGLLPKQVTWLNSKLNSLLDMMALPWQRKTSRYLANCIKDQPLLWGFSEWCYVSYPLTNAIAGTYNKQNAISILKTCVNLDPARSKRVNKSVPSYALDLLLTSIFSLWRKCSLAKWKIVCDITWTQQNFLRDAIQVWSNGIVRSTDSRLWRIYLQELMIEIWERRIW